MRRALRATLALTTLASALAPARVARAGNEDTVPLSNEAAIEGGAVTATIKGGGAAYANPAGLAHGDTDRLDVTATTYILRIASVPALGEGGPGVPVRTTKLTALDLTTVPSSLAYVRRLSKRTFASLGVFVPSQVDRNLTASVQTEPGAAPQVVTLASDIRQKSATYVVGPSLGVQVTPSLTLGMGVFATYERAHRSFSVYTSQGDAGGELVTLLHSHEARDLVSLGGQIVLSAQWHPTRRLYLGIALRSPRQQLYVIDQRVLMSGTGVAGSPRPTGTTSLSEQTGGSWVTLAPARADIGIAWQGDGWRVAVDGTFIGGHPGNDEVRVPLKPVMNIRAGGRLNLTRTLSVGAGVFTDRSQLTRIELTSTDANYFGVSVGAELGTIYLATPAPTPSAVEEPPAVPLQFKTALALRYAAGAGRTKGLAITPNAPGSVFTTYDQDILLHEIGVHLGSSLLF